MRYRQGGQVVLDPVLTVEHRHAANSEGGYAQLADAVGQHELTWVGVKGHAGDPGHEHAVALARRDIEEAATMVRSAR